ncbi:MAG: 3-hydroxyacyl-CoA dehydrogenase [Rhodospirillales bacterium]|nr:3-hydroxyacyl-CoA dehydrogenase [Rhodospirillales bacterium]
MPDKIAIVGSGLVGSAWAIVFARAGHRVALYDGTGGQCEAALARIETNLKALEGHGLIDDPSAARARISIAAGLADALDGATHAQESVFERADVKRAVYEEIDAIAGPELIVASSSSGIPASTFTEGLAIGPRCLIAHPINPPYVIPLVEIVPAPWTEEETVTRCWALMEAAGMEPVRLTREIDGFIANRLQAALLWEAFRLLEGGYATAKDIDTTISAGLGRRWSFIGPFETIDLNAPGGLADFCARLHDGFYEFIKQGEPAQPLSDAVVAKAHEERRTRLPMSGHGERQAWRDRRLMGLAAHLRDAGRDIGD